MSRSTPLVRQQESVPPATASRLMSRIRSSHHRTVSPRANFRVEGIWKFAIPVWFWPDTGCWRIGNTQKRRSEHGFDDGYGL